MFGKTETIFIPIPSYGVYKDLCNNVEYLSEVKEIAKCPVWITEITEAVKRIRDKADQAETPQELKAYNVALKIVKNLLVLSPAAEKVIKDITYREEINKMNNNASEL